MSGPGEISRSVSARRKVINVSIEGIVVESGKIFPLRYLSPIRAESGMYCSVSFWHRADVNTYSIGKLLNAASAAWRCQMRLHVSVESHGAESPV